MDRRTLLKAVAGAGTLAMSQKLAAPALAQGAAARMLRFVPQANLANFDPIWGTQYVVRNASAHGVGHALRRRRKPAAAAPDGGVRGGVRGRPDLDLQIAPGPQIPRRRAGARQGRGREPHPLGGARLHGPDAQGAAAGTHRRRRPHRQDGCSRSRSRRCCWRSARISTPMAFIMPERIAKTDPFKQITEYVGSGPMKLRAQRMGAGRQGGVRKIRRLCAAAGNRPPGSPAARSILVDRIEWVVMPDPATAAGRAAERRGRLVGEPDPRSRAAAARRTATSWSTSPTRSAISAASA